MGGMFRSVGHSMSGVGVLDKAVTILAACVDGASLAELVERTKLPRATAHRLAQALEIHRLLVRDAQGRWRPGPRLREVGKRGPGGPLAPARAGGQPRPPPPCGPRRSRCSPLYGTPRAKAVSCTCAEPTSGSASPPP